MESTRKISEAERASIQILIERVWQAAKGSQQTTPNRLMIDGLIGMWLADCPVWIQGNEGEIPVTEMQVHESIAETLVEQDRISKLSNSDLVGELHDCEVVWRYEILLDEAMSRLDPHFWERKTMEAGSN